MSRVSTQALIERFGDARAPDGSLVRENFARWFGESAVIDATGHPLIVFHGTASDVQSFDPQRSGRNYPGRGGASGFFFTSLPGTAEVYAEQAAEPWRTKGGAANIVPVYLSLQRPYVRLAQGSPDKWFDSHREALYATAARKGLDGIIVRGGAGVFERRMVYVAFRPEQIKSAIGNSGVFDPHSPDMADRATQDAQAEPQIERERMRA